MKKVIGILMFVGLIIGSLILIYTEEGLMGLVAIMIFGGILCGYVRIALYLILKE